MISMRAQKLLVTLREVVAVIRYRTIKCLKFYLWKQKVKNTSKQKESMGQMIKIVFPSQLLLNEEYFCYRIIETDKTI